MSTTTDFRPYRWLALFVALCVALLPVGPASAAGPAPKTTAAPTSPDAAPKPDAKTPKAKAGKAKAAEPDAKAKAGEPDAKAKAAEPETKGEPDAKAKAKGEPEGGAKPGGAEAGAKPTTVEAALEAGDLSTAAELARAQREANPSPETWRTEARVLERAGDYEGAAKAYAGLEQALPAGAKEARALARQDRERIDARMRGTVADEPPSTHRDELDDERAGAKAAKKKAAKKPDVAPPRSAAGRDRIITKWYFWVTIGAIVASAAAVTGIAIKAARDDEPDALGLSLEPRPMGPTILRF
jgi:hypothetical protein